MSKSSGVRFDDHQPRGSMQHPTQIGRWAVDKMLGRGGMGVVYLAHDPETGTCAAVKMMLAALADDESQLRFLREAESAGAVDHPRVVKLLEAGEHDDKPFIAFEFIDGGDLDRFLKQRRQLTDRAALTFIRGCAEGLQALHEAGLVHRDIKPANIFLDAERRPKLGDLGLARHTSGEDRFTMTGQAMGTPPYMSPEHIRGEGDIDIRTDIYALGATLYKLVTGTEPFKGDTPYAVTHAVLTQPAPDPRAINGMVSSALAAITLKCLAKQADQRYTTPRDLITDLDAAIANRPLLHATGGTPTMVVDDGATMPGTEMTGRATTTVPIGGGRSQGLPAWARVIGGGMAGRLVAVVVIVVVFTLFIIPSFTDHDAAQSAAHNEDWISLRGEDQHGVWAEANHAGSRFRMRFIPAGQVMLGHDPLIPGGGSSHPHRQVSGLWMAATEVTQSQYESVMGTNPSYYLDPAAPVEGVTQREAEAFCAALSNALGATVRLPTELEWEYSCRSTQSKRWPGGDTQGQVAWVASGALSEAWTSAEDLYHIEQAVALVLADDPDNPRYRPQRVGMKLANEWGLFDMLGNVSELTATSWDGASRLGVRASDEAFVVARGGSWFHHPTESTPATRMAVTEDEMASYLGFRFVIEP